MFAIADSYSIHSLSGNSIGNEGAMALAAAMETATNLQCLEYVNLATIVLCQCPLTCYVYNYVAS